MSSAIRQFKGPHLVGSFLVVLCILVGVGCSEDDSPADPNVDPTGAVQIQVTPETLAAPWNLTGPDSWTRSGSGNETIPGLPIGEYSVNWGDVQGWIAPGDDAGTLVKEGTLSFLGSYQQEQQPMGTIVIGLDPDHLAAAWTLMGPADYQAAGVGDRTLTGMSPGDYTLDWAQVEGWETEDGHQEGTLAANSTLYFSAQYQQVADGTIAIVPIGPGGEVPWALVGPDGDSTTDEGDALLTGMPPGEYKMFWGPVAGWATPGPQTLVLEDEGQIDFRGYYNPSVTMVGEAVTIPPVEVAMPATFVMGSDFAEWETPHDVILTRRFLMTETEVTYQEYVDALQWAFDQGHVRVTGQTITSVHDQSTTTVLDLNEGGTWIEFDGEQFSTGYPTRPVLIIIWYGVAAYCDWLNLQYGLPRSYNHRTWACDGGTVYGAQGYRLPTEAEWEFACRAGTTTTYSTGPCIDPQTEANFWGSLPVTGCIPGPNGSSTRPVRSYPPNPWGLYEMHGNIEEWVNDWSGSYQGDAVDPTGPTWGYPFKVARGGMYGTDGSQVRSAWRYGGGVDGTINRRDRGFRIVRTVQP